MAEQNESCKKEAPTADEAMGIVWWNRLTEEQRNDWMARAGSTGVVADAWATFKRLATKPTCIHCGAPAALLCDSCASSLGWERVRAQRLTPI